MTATTFSRQNDAGSRACTTYYRENLVLVVILLKVCKDLWDCYQGQEKMTNSWPARPQ